MTTGKTLKLVAYLNALSDCLKNPINDTGEAKTGCVNIEPGAAEEFVNTTKWNGSDVYIDGNDFMPKSVSEEIRILSGDISSEISFRAEYKPYDSKHAYPEYKFNITIDGEVIVVDKNGWR